MNSGFPPPLLSIWPKLEFLNIYWGPKSRLLKKSCLSKGHEGTTGLRQFLCIDGKEYFLETKEKNESCSNFLIRPSYYMY
jgi:hypothetical protein